VAGDPLLEGAALKAYRIGARQLERPAAFNS
jgi:hypothetical protein